MDLFTNIHKAAEIINKNKNTHIHILGGEEVELEETAPVGVSKSEWEECIARNIKAVLMTADDLETSFNCAFALADLRAKPEDGLAYETAMKVIIREIWSQYTYNRDLEAAFNSPGATVGSGSQTIQGSNTISGWSMPSLQTGFSNVKIQGDCEVEEDLDIKGELTVVKDIDAHGEIWVDGMSVSAEIHNLKNEIATLKALLASKGVV